MKQLFEENWCHLSCGQCVYFKVNADREESTCKRLDHKHIKFFKPYFKSYNCGQFSGCVCSDFAPVEWCVWLRQHWVSIDDYLGGEEITGYVSLVVDDLPVIYRVKKKDFFYNDFIDQDGNLKWFEKVYYKVYRNSPTGYKLVTAKKDCYE